MHDVAPDAQILGSAGALADWATEHQLDNIVTPYAPVGSLRGALANARLPVPIFEVRRRIDSTAWPLARAGFFKFRRHIPDLLDQFAWT